MIIIRILLFALLGLLGRGIYRAFKSSGSLNRRGPSGGPEESPGHNGPQTSRPMDDLTEQDISDADFEEIP